MTCNRKLCLRCLHCSFKRRQPPQKDKDTFPPLPDVDVTIDEPDITRDLIDLQPVVSKPIRSDQPTVAVAVAYKSKQEFMLKYRHNTNKEGLKEEFCVRQDKMVIILHELKVQVLLMLKAKCNTYLFA